jgi:ankyrin repeat protein
MEAIHQNDFEQVCKWISIGANVNAKFKDGQRPLHLAILNKNMEIFMSLLHATTQLDIRNKWKQTPLHLAVINGQYDMVFLLLERGANVNAKDANNHSPIYFAHSEDLTNIAMLLVDYGASVYGMLLSSELLTSI